jgi:hypothetical protein
MEASKKSLKKDEKKKIEKQEDLYLPAGPEGAYLTSFLV